MRRVACPCGANPTNHACDAALSTRRAGLAAIPAGWSEKPAGAVQHRITQPTRVFGPQAPSERRYVVFVPPGLASSGPSPRPSPAAAGGSTIDVSRITPSVPMAAATRASRIGVATTSPCP